MKKIILLINVFVLCAVLGSYAQLGESMYGDRAKADVKMKYVYSFEEALKKAKEEHKLIFFNCFADWAIPCHAMNKAVFSNQEFADWMDKHFVNFIIDVTTPEGRPLAEKYHIAAQVHYLVLDSAGNIVHRIVGGNEIPEFKKQLELALNPKTSLAGMDKSYEAGNRNANFLREYALVLRSADQKAKYDSVSNQYLDKIKSRDWPEKESWLIFKDKLIEPKGEMFDYMIAHKVEFDKNNGADAVNKIIVGLYFSPLYYGATGEKEIDGGKLLDIYMTLQKVNIPNDDPVYILYDIAKYQSERNFDKMMEIFEQRVPTLDASIASGLDFSLKGRKGLSAQERNRIVDYLTKRSEKLTGKMQGIYKAAIKDMVDPEGILFTDLSFDDAREKAKEDGKLLFVDCYTSWCGPCKMMSRQVFTQKAIGEFFNEHFVNLKVDMEKGEGPALQDKYGVKAYPTMMLLDGEGRIVYKILGGADARAFMEKIKRGSDAENCYYALKEKYESGDRSTDVMPRYLMTMMDAGELNDGEKMVQDYLSSLKNQERYLKVTWPLYELVATDYKKPEFQFICENRDHFVTQNGDGVVNKKIEKVIFPVMSGYLKGETSKGNLEKVKNLVAKAGLPTDFSLNYLQQIISLYDGKDMGKLLDFYENKVAGVADGQMRLNLDLLLARFMQNANAAEKEQIMNYVKKAREKADPQAKNGYQSLLKVLTQG